MASPAGPSAGKTRVAVMTSGGDAAGMNAAVRAVVKFALYKGCETYVIREGLSGLVNGNDHAETPDGSVSATPAVGSPAPQDKSSAALPPLPSHRYPWEKPYTRQQRFVASYGAGELLREGAGGSGESGLKGRYIIRVGWDDVRGWMEQVWEPHLDFGGAQLTWHRVARSSAPLAASSSVSRRAGGRPHTTSFRTESTV